jgi:hypothetical protein
VSWEYKEREKVAGKERAKKKSGRKDRVGRQKGIFTEMFYICTRQTIQMGMKGCAQKRARKNVESLLSRAFGKHESSHEKCGRKILNSFPSRELSKHEKFMWKI